MEEINKNNEQKSEKFEKLFSFDKTIYKNIKKLNLKNANSFEEAQKIFNEKGFDIFETPVGNDDL